MRLNVDHVSFRYPTGARDILDDACLEISAGKPCALMGPSGEGKSTLLYLIAGLLQPTSGTISLERGEMQSKPDPRVAWVFQSPSLLTHRTALDNVSLALLAGGNRRAEAEPEAREALALVGLGDHINEPVRRLSGGQAQRVAIARSLVSRPNILLVDEPTANLDFDTGRAVVETLLSAASHAVVVLATHDARIADLVGTTAFLSAGHVSVRTSP